MFHLLLVQTTGALVWFTLDPFLSGDPSRLPPHRAFLQNLESVRARIFIFGRIRYLLLATNHNNAHPVIVTRSFINLQTDQRIGAHPLDLLPQRGAPVEMLSIVREVDRHNVGLITPRAGQPAETPPLECPAAFVLSHLVNKHRKLSWSECPRDLRSKDGTSLARGGRVHT